jgi:hypothetical protein
MKQEEFLLRGEESSISSTVPGSPMPFMQGQQVSFIYFATDMRCTTSGLTEKPNSPSLPG